MIEYLIEVFGYPPSLLSVAGYGDIHPLVENVDEKSRSKNRRVDLVLLTDKNY